METLFDCLIVGIIMTALTLYLGVALMNIVAQEVKKLFKSLFN